MGSARGEARRRRVLEASVAAIAETGVEDLTLADIATRAGMSPGHMLYYFGSKDRILTETLTWSEHDLAATRQARLREQPTGPGALRWFVDLYLPAGSRDPRWNLWAQLLARPPADPAEAAALDGLSDLWRADLEGLLSAIEDRGRRSRAARQACYLLDGIAMDLIAGTAGIARPAAVELAVAGIEALAAPEARQPSR